MARPQKQGLDYFPHDTDAAGDDKIEIMRALYGNDGYAFYFILLERIYQTDHTELDVSDPEIIQILAKKVAVTEQQFADMLQTALKWHLFDPDAYATRHVLTSNGAKARVRPVLWKRQQMRLNYAQEVSGVVSAAGIRSKVKESKVILLDTKVSNRHGDLKDELTPSTEASKYLFEKTGRKRWGNSVQKQAFENVEKEVGPQRVIEAVDWALLSGISNIKSILTAAKKEVPSGRHQPARTYRTIANRVPVDGKYTRPEDLRPKDL